MNAVILALTVLSFAFQDEMGADGDLLRGPTVNDEVARTLITVDIRGEFIPLNGRPEEAALGLVDIDPERLDQARAAIAARNNQLGMLLVDNIDLVREATDALRSGESGRAQQIYADLYLKCEPEGLRDPLLHAFADILAPEEQAEVVRLVDEYWSALVDWRLRDAGELSDDERKNTEQQLAYAVFQQELAEAYNWSLRPYRYRLEMLYEVTEATPEQRTAIRAAVLDHVRETRLQATPEQRWAVTEAIYTILDDDQRKRLIGRAIWY